MPRGENIEQKTDAYIDGIWYIIARNTMTYNPQGKRMYRDKHGRLVL